MGLVKNALIDFESFMNKIHEYRNNGEFNDAINECIKHVDTSEFKDFKFYYYLELGELYSLIGNFEKSLQSYTSAYENIIDEQRTFKAFARSVDRFVKNSPNNYYETFRLNLINRITIHKINIAYQSSILINHPFPIEEFLSHTGKELASLLLSDARFQRMVDVLKELEIQNSDELLIILDMKVLERKRTRQTIRIDKYCITVYERFERYYKAQKIAYELIEVEQDSVTIRSLFRICRKMDDYSLANQLLLKYPNIEKRNDFNVLYELVYYYDKINNTLAKKNALEKIESNSSSKPIIRTLKNLYLRFGTFEDVLRVEHLINESSFNGNVINTKVEAEKDSEASVWSALKNSRRLEALANLTRGISHELGQPITNIRFMLQYYMNKGTDKLDSETIQELFQTVLFETERMGNLINRLSPITTARNTTVEYNMMDRIRQRIKAEQLRLKDENIFVDIPPIPSINILGDPSMFDQIISNLLINSIHSLQTVYRKRKKISIRVKDEKTKIRLSFQDNGAGISHENRRRIFEPFFTTKQTGQGQGLGLFIIWNLLKYQGGTIFLDYKFVDGARFIVELPKEATHYE